MRKTHVFILRLLAGENEPLALHGMLRPLDGAQEYPFKDEGDLFSLLRKLVEQCEAPAIEDGDWGQ